MKIIIPGELQKCLYCGKEIYRKPSLLRFRPYCNRNCYALGRRTGKDNICESCNNLYYRKPGNVKKFGTRFCSLNCMRKTLKKEYSNEKVYNWKGQEASYMSIHSWIRRHKGRATICIKCGSKRKRKYEWANIDGLYKRSLDQFISLCTSCHRKHDNKLKGEWI